MRNRIREMVEEFEKENKDTKKKLNDLISAVHDHYNQKSDNRCHLDDDLLYWKVLGIGSDPYATALPPKDCMMKSCDRYYEQRQHPEVKGKAWMPHEMTIAQLTELVEEYERVIRDILKSFDNIINKS